MEKYRKLPNNLEEPLSNYLYKIVHIVSNIITDNITPNEITIFNILLRIIILYKLNKCKYDKIYILLIISCFLDYLDGYTARRYNMITKLGDYLDHIGDYIFTIIILYIIYYKLRNSKFKKLFIIIILLFIICISFNLGCQEKYFSKNNSNTLNIFKLLCYDIKILKITKYFGCLLFYLFISYIIYNNLYFFNNNNKIINKK